MSEKTLKGNFITTDTISGFYGCTIPINTILYPFKRAEEGLFDNGHWHYRFVFDTIENATAHNLPLGNSRTSIWYTQGKWDSAIKQLK